MLKDMLRSALIPLLIAGGLAGCDINDPVRPEPDKPSRTSAELIAFDSCEALESALKEHLKAEMRVQLLSYRDMVYLDTPGSPQPEPASPEDDAGDRTEGVDYSGTNNQEAGVDESDFVKTDGYALYLLSGSEFILLEVPQYGRLDNGTRLTIEGDPGQMLLYRETPSSRAVKAVVFSSVYSWGLEQDHPLYEHVGRQPDGSWSGRSATLTKITVIDLSDPAEPQITGELYFEGYFQTARRVDSALHLIAYSWMDVYGLQYWPELPRDYYLLPPESPSRQQAWDQAVAEAVAHNDAVIDQLGLVDLVPMLYEVDRDGTVTRHDIAAAACTNFIIAEDGVSRGFTSILSFDLADAALSIDSDHIVSNQSIVYASTDTLLIAEPAQDWWWYWEADDFEEATNLHRFDISATGTAVYSGSGRVAGTIENQFCLSEYNDRIRVAATTGQWGRWWLAEPAEPENFVYVLAAGDNGSLSTVGQVGPLAAGERIWSARFVDDQAFLVTFRNIDPLWAIDLSDPENPVVQGELEVPGVSTYIHPIDDEHLLTIGYGGDDEGLDWSVQVSLFDVSDFARPTLVDSLPLAPPAGEGWESWASSEATWEHKAFQYWAPRKLLAVPLSTSRYLYEEGPGFYTYTYEYVSKLELIAVDPQAGLSVYGSIDQSDFYNSAEDTYWCSRDIRRSIFMGDYLYAVGDRAVTATGLDNMTRTAAVNLPGTDCSVYYGEGVVDTGGEER